MKVNRSGPIRLGKTTKVKDTNTQRIPLAALNLAKTNTNADTAPGESKGEQGAEPV